MNLTQMKTTQLLDAETMLANLLKVSDERHFQERFYPILTKQAGRRLNGLGVLITVQLAIADYTDGLPPLVARLLEGDVESYCAAIIDDAEVLADMRRAHKEILETSA